MDGLRDIRVSEEDVEEVLSSEHEFRRWYKNADRRRRAGGEGCVPSHQTLDAYPVRIGAIETLTHEQTEYLCKRVRAGIHAENRLASEELDDGDARRMERLVEIGAMAREQMVLANIPLVLTLSKRHPRGEVPFIDFVQAGTTGLVRAIDQMTTRGVSSSPPMPPSGSAKGSRGRRRRRTDRYASPASHRPAFGTCAT